MRKFVAFSGGKDSTALALLEHDAILAFTDTGWEFDEIYQHLDRFERVTGRQVIRIKHPQYESLPAYIRDYRFMPGHGARYCTRIFKIESYNHFIRQQLPAELLIALRADEPEDERTGNLTKLEGLTIRYPLRERGLNRLDVVKICLDYGLLPLYPPYMARGGCKGCFYKRKSEVIAMAYQTPQELDELQALEETIQDERGEFAFMFPNTGMSIRQLRHQMLPFSVDEIYRDALDDSDKGVACGLFCHR